MTILKSKLNQVTDLLQSMSGKFQGKPFARLFLDGHHTPDTGARMARLFPLHLQLELTLSSGTIEARGTLDIESSLPATPVEGVLHPVPWTDHPFLELSFPDAAGQHCTLIIRHLPPDFLATLRLEGRIEGSLAGDLGLHLPSEQFLRILQV